MATPICRLKITYDYLWRHLFVDWHDDRRDAEADVDSRSDGDGDDVVCLKSWSDMILGTYHKYARVGVKVA